MEHLICQIARELDAAGIPYSFEAATALGLQGIPVPGSDDIDLSVQRGDLAKVHALYGGYQPGPVAERQGWATFRFEREGIPVDVLAYDGTVIWDDPDRVAVPCEGHLLWCKSAQFFHRSTPPGHPRRALIELHQGSVPTVRLARQSDLEALAELYMEFHNFHARGVPTYLQVLEQPDDGLIPAISRIMEDKQAILFVLCEGDAALGFVEAYIKETAATPAVVQRRYAHIQSLMVTAARRKQGVGTLLLEAAHHWARHRGAREVELDIWEFAAGPLGFYQALGYATVKRLLAKPLL